MEGRAARRRLRAVVLGRADRDRGGRRGDRGVGAGCATTCCAATRPSTPTGCTSSTTASTPRSTSPTAAPTCWSGSGIDPDRPSRGLRRADHPAEGPAAPAARGRCRCDPAVQLVLLRRRAGHRRRSLAEVDACWSTELRARPRTASSGSRRCCPSRRSIQVLTHATVFVCPSVYEPMGIVNLEAMACETAVVATATGGIPEVVADGETGLLVPIEQATDGSGTPLDPARFEADLAAAHLARCSPTRRGPARWAWPGGAARSSSSPGRPSPPGRWTSTAGCSDGVRPRRVRCRRPRGRAGPPCPGRAAPAAGRPSRRRTPPPRRRPGPARRSP